MKPFVIQTWTLNYHIRDPNSFKINTHQGTLSFKFLQGFIFQEISSYRFQWLRSFILFLLYWFIGQNIYLGVKKYYFCTLWTELSIWKNRRVVLTLRNVLYLEVLYRRVWQDSQAYLHLWWEWGIFLQLQTLPKDRRHTMLQVYCNNRKLSFNINHY